MGSISFFFVSGTGFTENKQKLKHLVSGPRPYEVCIPHWFLFEKQISCKEVQMRLLNDEKPGGGKVTSASMHLC
jgi:hypothetical protein